MSMKIGIVTPKDVYEKAQEMFELNYDSLSLEEILTGEPKDIQAFVGVGIVELYKEVFEDKKKKNIKVVADKVELNTNIAWLLCEMGIELNAKYKIFWEDGAMKFVAKQSLNDLEILPSLNSVVEKQQVALHGLVKDMGIENHKQLKEALNYFTSDEDKTERLVQSYRDFLTAKRNKKVNSYKSKQFQKDSSFYDFDE